MIEYTKIETVFNRDIEGTKKLIEGSYRSPAIEYLKDNLWSCTEKIDGTNIGVVWDGHRVSFQGRTERAQIPAPLVNRLNEMFGGPENEELFEQLFGEKEAVLFGEGYGPKIQKGGELYRDDISFIMFDVWVDGIWLDQDAMWSIAGTFGADHVPVILVGTLQDAIEFVKKKPMSTIGKAPMEGLVCRPVCRLMDHMGRRIIVKVKVKDFE